jgi:hypothetical protein
MIAFLLPRVVAGIAYDSKFFSVPSYAVEQRTENPCVLDLIPGLDIA